MYGVVIDLVNYFHDLGLIFGCKLDFKNYITQTVSKATCILGFIKRWAKEFSDPYVTQQLFITLVRSILEYGSVIWDLQYTVRSDKI